MKSTPSFSLMYLLGTGSFVSSIIAIIRCPMVCSNSPVFSIPKQVVKLAWLSKSTASTFFPIFCREYARFNVVVVLPTPPFCEPIIYILPINQYTPFPSATLHASCCCSNVSIKFAVSIGVIISLPSSH